HCCCLPPLLLLLFTLSSFFFFNDPTTTEIYTLSLHDALPIFHHVCRDRRASAGGLRRGACGFDVEERDRGAGTRQRLRVLAAKASRAAGDDRDVPVEREQRGRGGRRRHSRVAVACRRVVPRRSRSASRASSRV